LDREAEAYYDVAKGPPKMAWKSGGEEDHQMGEATIADKGGSTRLSTLKYDDRVTIVKKLS
jgi:hypothetical protein